MTWIRAVIEKEEDWACDGVDKVAGQTKLECWDESGLCVGIVANEVGDCVEKLDALVHGVCSDSSPDLAVHASRVRLRGDLGDDSKLITTSSEGPPQVVVRGSVCVCNCAVCKDNLKVIDIVARQTLER